MARVVVAKSAVSVVVSFMVCVCVVFVWLDVLNSIDAAYLCLMLYLFRGKRRGELAECTSSRMALMLDFRRCS